MSNPSIEALNEIYPQFAESGQKGRYGDALRAVTAAIVGDTEGSASIDADVQLTGLIEDVEAFSGELERRFSEQATKSPETVVWEVGDELEARGDIAGNYEADGASLLVDIVTAAINDHERVIDVPDQIGRLVDDIEGLRDELTSKLSKDRTMAF